MMIKRREIGKNAYSLYSSTSLFLYSNVDEALYGIVWYGPLMVAVNILLSLDICLPWP